MTSQERIIKLNEIWYDLVACECHKERDVHFYIIVDYHYGETVSYTVEHKGYIVHNYENSNWDTMEEAELELISLLKNSIIEEASWYIEHYGDPDWDQHPRYDKDDLEEIVTRVMLIAGR
jgi:hypothetical protein